MSWETELRQRFDGRRGLSLSELAHEFGVSEDESSELQACLNVFAQEYGVTTNTLRSDDSLQSFVEPAPSRNLVKAYFDQAAIDDSVSELNYMLKKRRRHIGVPLKRSPMTIGEYVAAWFGIDKASRDEI